MEQIMEAQNLTKGFFSKKAVRDFTFQFMKGKVYGLLGPNGSGKTTFMKIAAGLLKPTSGTVKINGEPIQTKTKEWVSYMPTDDYLYGWMKIKRVFQFYEDLYADFDRKEAESLLAYMDLTDDLKVASLSTGMKGRLKLAVTLARKVPIYMLDEPLNGIDPVSREKIMKAIVGKTSENSTFLISSHLVSELETILDEVIFLNEGSIYIQGEAESLRQKKGKSIEELYKEVYR